MLNCLLFTQGINLIHTEQFEYPTNQLRISREALRYSSLSIFYVGLSKLNYFPMLFFEFVAYYLTMTLGNVDLCVSFLSYMETL